jgi:hypothetical protein
MTFDELIATIGFCRHCIVHNEGRVEEEKLVELNRFQRAFVTSCLHASLHGNGRLLLPTSKSADRTMEALASYGWALYVLLSERCAMEDESQLFLKMHKSLGPRQRNGSTAIHGKNDSVS